MIREGFTNYITHLQVTHAQSTIKTYTSILHHFIEEYDETLSPLENYTNHIIKLRKNKKSSGYITLQANIIKQYLEYLDVPTSKIDVPRANKNIRDSLTQRQQEIILRATSEEYIHHTIILLMNTGLRISEACNLRWLDVDIPNRKLKVLHGKGDKQRNIPLNDKAIQTLKNLQQYKHEYVITTWQGKKTTPRAVQHQFKKLTNKVGFHVTPHILRHTFATNMINKGVPITTLQKIMGHTSIETTNKYIHQNWQQISQTFLEAQ